MFSDRFFNLKANAPAFAVSPDAPQFVGWKRDCEALIKKVYGASSSEFTDFRDIRFEWRSIATATRGPGAPALFQEALERASAFLDSCGREQQEEENEQSNSSQSQQRRRPGLPDSKKIFIVHGHDEALKLKVARVLERLKLEPVILNELPDQAQTIIEKLEANSGVGFAVVLLTADDECSTKGQSGPLKSRARQNVVFEYGYFVGQLGRNRVMALKADGVEGFSDNDGVIFTKVDEAEAWRYKLGQELKTAGYAIDLNNL